MGKLFVVALLALLSLAADPATKAVSMKDMAFSPANVEITVGDTIKWTNNDDRDHTVASSDKSFTSENLRSGETFSHTFTKAGKFTYTCSYHPRMKGTVTVKEK